MITIDVTVTAGSYADAQHVQAQFQEQLSDQATVSPPYRGADVHGVAGWLVAVRLGDATDATWAADVDGLLSIYRQLMDQRLIH